MKFVNTVWGPKNGTQLFNKMVHSEGLMLTPHRGETCSQSIIYNKLIVFDGNFLVFIMHYYCYGEPPVTREGVCPLSVVPSVVILHNHTFTVSLCVHIFSV